MARKIKKQKAKPSVAELMVSLSDDFTKAGFLGDSEELQIMPSIFPSFNRASLIGGLPSACICEFHGPNQGGKTTLGLGLLVSAQRHGHLVGIVDGEGKAIYVLGRKKSFEDVADKVNESIEKFLEFQEKNKEAKDTWFIWMVDSLTSLVPKKELEGSIGDANYGLHANLASRWLKKLNNLILGTNITVMFINQERKKINAKPFEKDWHSACGEALQYYAHFRVRVARANRIKLSEIHAGWKHNFTVEKNKVSACDEHGCFFTSTGRHDSLPLGWDMPRLYVTEGLNQGIVAKEGKKVSCDYNEDTKEGMFESKLIELIRKDSDAVAWFLKQFEERQDDAGKKEEECDSNRLEEGSKEEDNS